MVDDNKLRLEREYVDPMTIERDPGLQSRDIVDERVVLEYAQLFTDGVLFPPVVVYYDKDKYWLADGWHRVEAAIRADLEEIEVDLRQGTRRDALLYSIGANAAHGLRRTNADKERAVDLALGDDELRATSDRAIAKLVGVTHPFVAKRRRAMFPPELETVTTHEPTNAEDPVSGEASLQPASAPTVGDTIEAVLRGRDASQAHPTQITFLRSDVQTLAGRRIPEAEWRASVQEGARAKRWSTSSSIVEDRLLGTIWLRAAAVALVGKTGGALDLEEPSDEAEANLEEPSATEAFLSEPLPQAERLEEPRRSAPMTAAEFLTKESSTVANIEILRRQAELAERLQGELIDLRCCSVEDLLDSLEDDVAALAVFDPAWTYSQSNGSSRPDDHYETQSISEIVTAANKAHRISARLALWITCPLLGEWIGAKHRWGQPVTCGAWIKSRQGDEGHYGQGYHWAGVSELVLIYTQEGSHTNRSVALRNGWIEPPRQHSAKPIDWQAQWIQRWVPPGGLVIDLCAGLGSVALATLQAGGGRRYIGAEIDPVRHLAALDAISALIAGGAR